jgi:hypothetical protein
MEKKRKEGVTFGVQTPTGSRGRARLHIGHDYDMHPNLM